MKIAAHTIASIGMIINFMSLQQKRKKNIMTYQLIANIMFTIQYLFLGLHSAACAASLASLRGYFFRNREKETKRVRKLMVLVTLFLISSIISYNGLFSLIPIILGTITIISACYNKPQTYKIVFGLCAIVWVYYNYKVEAYVCAIDCALCVVSATIDYFKSKEKNNN